VEAPRRARIRDRSHAAGAGGGGTPAAGSLVRGVPPGESRALGKPKETVEHQDGKTEVDEALDHMST
jgi:hypothetical protein